MNNSEQYYENINLIARFCDKVNIPYSLNSLFDGLQICFPWTQGDIACHSGTTRPFICVESFRFPWDGDDITVESPSKMCVRLLKHWHEKQDC